MNIDYDTILVVVFFIIVYLFMFFSFFYFVNKYKLKNISFFKDETEEGIKKKINRSKNMATNANLICFLMIAILFMLDEVLGENSVLICLIFISAVIISRVNNHFIITNMISGIVVIPIIMYCVVMSVFLPYNMSYKAPVYNLSEVIYFNHKFLAYEGERIAGSQVRSLLQKITENNLDTTNIEEKRIVDIETNVEGLYVDESGIVQGGENIKANLRYEISFKYNDNNDNINKVVITQKVNSTATSSPDTKK